MMNVPAQVECTNQVYSKAIDLVSANSFLGWRQLSKQVWSNARESLVQLGQNELLSEPRLEHTEDFVDKAVESISPLISLALAGVESGTEQLKDQKTVFLDLLSVSDSDLSPFLTWEQLRHTLGYGYHSLHGALCLDMGQIDLALDLARVKVDLYRAGDFREVWEESALVGWSQLLGKNHCTKGWQYIASAYERWKWLSPIFADDLKYRTSLVAYYLALHIHELASVIASGRQEILRKDPGSWNWPWEFRIPLSFLSEDRDVNERAISRLRHSPGVTELWTSLDVTRAKMEDSWDNWLRACKVWLSKVYESSLPEVHHKHFFENF